MTVRSAEAEYFAQFRTDIESFIKLDEVERCVSIGIADRPPLSGCRYRAFVDPSGGSHDSMTLAIAHKQDQLVVIDRVLERKPPFSPLSVVEQFSAILKLYRINKVDGDRYAGEWPREQFRQHGIGYEVASKSKSELYVAFLPLLTSQMVELVDQPRLIQQIVGLERRTARGGRDTVDHPPNGHDDLANVVAGVSAMFASQSSYDTSLAWVGGDDLDLQQQEQLRFNRYVTDRRHGMKHNIKVRGRDGAIRSVNDDYILRDGEARVVELPFMDAQGRPMIHDGRGHPAGQRPGFLYSDNNEQAERALADAYTEYDEAIQNRWRGQQQIKRNPNRRRSTVRKMPALPPMRNMTGPFRSAGANDRLPIRAADRGHR